MAELRNQNGQPCDHVLALNPSRKGRWNSHSSDLSVWPFPICLDKGHQRGHEGQRDSVPGQFSAQPSLLLDGLSVPGFDQP